MLTAIADQSRWPSNHKRANTGFISQPLTSGRKFEFSSRSQLRSSHRFAMERSCPPRTKAPIPSALRLTPTLRLCSKTAPLTNALKQAHENRAFSIARGERTKASRLRAGLPNLFANLQRGAPTDASSAPELHSHRSIS